MFIDQISENKVSENLLELKKKRSRDNSIEDVVTSQYSFSELFLEEVNPLETVYPFIEKQLSEYFKESLTQLSDQDIISLIYEGTGNVNMNNYDKFVLKDDSLVLIFPSNQIVEDSLGVLTVEIKLEDLEDILNYEVINEI